MATLANTIVSFRRNAEWMCVRVCVCSLCDFDWSFVKNVVSVVMRCVYCVTAHTSTPAPCVFSLLVYRSAINNRFGACVVQIAAADERGVERVYTIVLSDKQLDAVPRWLARFPSLRSVDLGFNHIGVCPNRS